MNFFLLVFALSIPLWVIGAVTRIQLLPGLPVSSLMSFCPLIAASILVYRENRIAGVIELLKRSFDYRRIRSKVWYVPTILLMPGIAILAYGLMRLVRLPLPTPQFPRIAALLMFLAFFVGALGEELGWSGYAIDPMQDRWNALQASILLGLIGAVWHVIPLAQADRSATWIAWQCLNLVALRVLLVWLYNNTGKSVFAAALCHAMVNVSWQLFPNYGSHYDPRIIGLLTVFSVIIVTVVWGPRTLARNKNI
ncbi:MAG: CPBP family intramembrane metalloprotease [Candidatus Aminicenantes bacterium]|nr:CPBP family intramembrane metalloprotease [Candidatus Aminicenantes bacterium]